ncbi:MAG: hypothetical protein J6J24_02345, partial [Clostridia bacterium]|nr:hypothetical protein [Clostridia bacterium]
FFLLFFMTMLADLTLNLREIYLRRFAPPACKEIVFFVGISDREVVEVVKERQGKSLFFVEKKGQEGLKLSF